MLNQATVGYILRSFILGWIIGYMGLVTTIILGILIYIAFQFRGTVIDKAGEGLAFLINRVPEGCLYRSGTQYTKDDMVRKIHRLGYYICYGERWIIYRGVFLSHIFDIYNTMHADFMADLPPEPNHEDEVSNTTSSSQSEPNHEDEISDHELDELLKSSSRNMDVVDVQDSRPKSKPSPKIRSPPPRPKPSPSPKSRNV